MRKIIQPLLAVVLFASVPGWADDTEALAKASQNPVADMISLPIQHNANLQYGPDDEYPINTANWEADSGEKWTVPVGGGMGRIFRVGKQPMNANFQMFYNVEAPEVVGDWSIRAQLQWMFPR